MLYSRSTWRNLQSYKFQLNQIRTYKFHLKLLNTAVILKYNQGHWKCCEWVKVYKLSYHGKFDIYHLYKVLANFESFGKCSAICNVLKVCEKFIIQPRSFKVFEFWLCLPKWKANNFLSEPDSFILLLIWIVIIKCKYYVIWSVDWRMYIRVTCFKLKVS